MTLEQALALSKGQKIVWTEEALLEKYCTSKFAKEWGNEIEFERFWEEPPGEYELSLTLLSGKVVAIGGGGLPMIYVKTKIGIQLIASVWLELGWKI